MCESSVSKVTSINVEIMGRRLSFTYEEAVALKGVLQDALGETYVVEHTVPPVYGPVYGPIPYKEWWSSLDDYTTGTRPLFTSTI